MINMKIIDIRKYGDPVLRKKAKPVKKITPEIMQLIKDMFETMYNAPGIGLAASQVGIPLRIAVIDYMPDGTSNPMVIINPKILTKKNKIMEEEGCLSIPGVVASIPRFESVSIKCLDHQGMPVVIEGKGVLAQAIQHEIDHMNGKLFIDRVSFLKRRKLKREIRQLKKAGTW